MNALQSLEDFTGMKETRKTKSHTVGEFKAAVWGEHWGILRKENASFTFQKMRAAPYGSFPSNRQEFFADGYMFLIELATPDVPTPIPPSSSLVCHFSMIAKFHLKRETPHGFVGNGGIETEGYLVSPFHTPFVYHIPGIVCHQDDGF